MTTRSGLVLGALMLAALAGVGAGAQVGQPVLSEGERQAIVRAARSLTAADLAEAVRKADAGDLDAQVLVAQAFLQSNSPHRDPPRAVPYLEQAAARGHPLAQNGLGACYLRGDALARDEAQAALWIRKAVAQGLAQAMYVLGMMHKSGEGVERDEAEALRLWRASAEQGNPWGQTALGTAYEVGEVVPRDVAAAAEWYRKAALQENPEAQALLAILYINGNGVPRDRNEANRLLRSAAEQGHAVAQFNLALAYTRGEGLPKSNEEAATWLRRSSEQGYATATCMLGGMYWSGAIGDRWSRASDGFELLKKCAAQGSAAGALALGEIFVRERDHREACTWLVIARDLEKTPDWQENWARLQPRQSEEVRTRLPTLFAEVRKKLKPQQLADCEDEAARWMQAQGIVRN